MRGGELVHLVYLVSLVYLIRRTRETRQPRAPDRPPPSPLSPATRKLIANTSISDTIALISERAVEVSVYAVRAFVKLRELLGTHKKLAQKLAQLERRVESHDDHIHSLFEAIRQLMEPPTSRSRRIGFKTRESER